MFTGKLIATQRVISSSKVLFKVSCMYYIGENPSKNISLGIPQLQSRLILFTVACMTPRVISSVS